MSEGIRARSRAEGCARATTIRPGPIRHIRGSCRNFCDRWRPLVGSAKAEDIVMLARYGSIFAAMRSSEEWNR